MIFMTRTIDHSPFDTAQPHQESEDWLEDLEKSVGLVSDGETARELSDLRKSLELRLASLTIPQLENRLKNITSKLEPLIQERNLRQKASKGEDEIGLEAINKKILPLGVEEGVIYKLITQRKQQQMEIDRIALIEDSVVPTIKGEPSEEEVAAKTEASRQMIERAKERAASLQPERTAARKEHKSGGFFVAKSPAKTEREMAAAQKAIKLEQEKARFEKDLHIAETKAHAYDIKNIQTRPESFWSHVKRSWFGSTPESVKQARRESVIFDKGVRARDKEREAVQQTREDLTQYRVISARQGGSPTQEPGFFGKLWKNLSGQARREERASAYRSNIEKVHGRLPEYRSGIGQDALRPKKEQPKEEKAA